MGRLGLYVTLFVVVGAAAGVTVWDMLYQPAGIAPDFVVTSTGYENGTQGEPVTFALSDYRGKVVVLDLMAVACTTCRQVTDLVLKPLYETYGNRSDFVILSVDTWADPAVPNFVGGFETDANVIQLQKDEDTPWRHALDTDNVWRKYSAVSLPKVVVIDPEGVIVHEVGGVPSRASVEAKVLLAFEGEAGTVDVLRVGLFGLAFVAGVASFFSPCSVALIPAYLGFLLQTTKDVPAATRVRKTLSGGLLTGAGIVALYALLAVLFFFIGRWINPYIKFLAPAMAVLLIVLGIMMFRGLSWDRLAVKLGMGKVDGRKGFFAFGVGYGLAAFGCTGPVFLPILFGGFVEGTVTGFVVFLIYALSIAGFVLLAAGLIAGGHASSLRTVLAKTEIITRVSSVVIVLAGLYMLWFYARAYDLFGL